MRNARLYILLAIDLQSLPFNSTFAHTNHITDKDGDRTILAMQLVWCTMLKHFARNVIRLSQDVLWIGPLVSNKNRCDKLHKSTRLQPLITNLLTFSQLLLSSERPLLLFVAATSGGKQKLWTRESSTSCQNVNKLVNKSCNLMNLYSLLLTVSTWVVAFNLAKMVWLGSVSSCF